MGTVTVLWGTFRRSQRRPAKEGGRLCWIRRPGSGTGRLPVYTQLGLAFPGERLTLRMKNLAAP